MATAVVARGLRDGPVGAILKAAPLTEMAKRIGGKAAGRGAMKWHLTCHREAAILCKSPMW